MTGPGSAAQGSDNAIEIAAVPVDHDTRQLDHDTDANRLGTTHDVHGGGQPRLVALFDDSIDIKIANGDGTVPLVCPLQPGTTVIGSDLGCDIVLPQVAYHQAEVRRDEVDDYLLFDTSPDHSTLVAGRPALGRRLHAGDRVSLAGWTVVFERAESAVHGSPYGGHSGGLPHGTRKSQPTPRPRGTSPSGGAEPTADDPGEYF